MERVQRRNQSSISKSPQSEESKNIAKNVKEMDHFSLVDSAGFLSSKLSVKSMSPTLPLPSASVRLSAVPKKLKKDSVTVKVQELVKRITSKNQPLVKKFEECMKDPVLYQVAYEGLYSSKNPQDNLSTMRSNQNFIMKFINSLKEKELLNYDKNFNRWIPVKDKDIMLKCVYESIYRSFSGSRRVQVNKSPTDAIDKLFCSLLREYTSTHTQQEKPEILDESIKSAAHKLENKLRDSQCKEDMDAVVLNQGTFLTYYHKLKAYSVNVRIQNILRDFNEMLKVFSEKDFDKTLKDSSEKWFQNVFNTYPKKTVLCFLCRYPSKEQSTKISDFFRALKKMAHIAADKHVDIPCQEQKRSPGILEQERQKLV